MEDVSNSHSSNENEEKNELKTNDVIDKNLTEQSTNNSASSLSNNSNDTNDLSGNTDAIQKETNANESNKLEEQKNVNNSEVEDKSNKSDDSQDKMRKLAPSPTSNCILFYGVTYLGCSSVNAPKSEVEINRVMSTLNEQGQLCIEVTMSVPQSIEEKIILYDSSNMDSKIVEYV